MSQCQYKQSVANAFSAATATYDKAAFIEQQISLRLIERLQYFPTQPKRILDIGCGTGSLITNLGNLFPNSSIIGIDIAFGMAKFARQSVANPATFLCADAEALPFMNKSFDLVIANCSFMWIKNANQLFQEISRIITKDGLLFFSTFGPNTLLDLQLPNTWPDLITIGNAMTSANLRNPVIEGEQIIFEYGKLEDLLLDLDESGTCKYDNTLNFPELIQPYNANFEVIYGHAWGNSRQQFKDEQGNVYIPIEDLMSS